jgi:hypothetical protein
MSRLHIASVKNRSVTTFLNSSVLKVADNHKKKNPNTITYEKTYIFYYDFSSVNKM